METFAIVLLLIVGALSFQMPVYIARLFGEERALNNLWQSVASGSLANMILFVTAYMLFGFFLWSGPVGFVIMLAHPQHGAGLRRRGHAVLNRVTLPVRPLFLMFLRHVDKWEGEYVERKKLRDIYDREFADQFQSFEQFRRYYRWINDQNYVDPRQPFTASADKFQDAVILLGLPNGFTQQDLIARFSKLMKVIHPDIVGMNDIARRLNDARAIIKARKGWK
jgi:hypothetical protein